MHGNSDRSYDAFSNETIRFRKNLSGIWVIRKNVIKNQRKSVFTRSAKNSKSIELSGSKFDATILKPVHKLY